MCFVTPMKRAFCEYGKSQEIKEKFAKYSEDKLLEFSY